MEHKTSFDFLIVDDSEIDRMISKTHIKFTVNDFGEIHEAENGLQALAWIKSNFKDIKQRLVILLDISMPTMDGFEFLENYDKLDNGVKEKIKIIMLSSSVAQNDIQRANENKYVEKLLTKPFPSDKVKGVLERL